jgi:uncharacterized membrane protein
MDMEEKQSRTQEFKREKEYSALSYLWIFSLFILLAKRDDSFIQHHARRGFVLFVLSILLWLVPVLRYGEFLVLALMIFGFIKAAMGEENTLPVLSEIADGNLRARHIKHYWHHAKHGAIKVVKPEHVTPTLVAEVKEQEKELSEQEKLLEKEKHMIEIEEKKISSLYHRVAEDEKQIDKLEDEVHHLEDEMKELKK